MAEEDDIPPEIKEWSKQMFAEAMEAAYMVRDMAALASGFTHQLTEEQEALWTLGAANGYYAALEVLKRHSMLTPPKKD